MNLYVGVLPEQLRIQPLPTQAHGAHPPPGGWVGGAVAAAVGAGAAAAGAVAAGRAITSTVMNATVPVPEPPPQLAHAYPPGVVAGVQPGGGIGMLPPQVVAQAITPAQGAGGSVGQGPVASTNVAANVADSAAAAAREAAALAAQGLRFGAGLLDRTANTAK